MKKPRCGEWMSHKFREGNGPTQDNCLRCGWLHADVARARREACEKRGVPKDIAIAVRTIKRWTAKKRGGRLALGCCPLCTVIFPLADFVWPRKENVTVKVVRK